MMLEATATHRPQYVRRILPEDRGKVPHKKAEIELQSNECTANCELLKKQ